MDLPDPAVFLPLFLQHQPALYAFVLANGIAPTDAEDVIQNAAVVLWRRFAEFVPGTDFRAWAFAVVRLEIRKQGARAARERRVLRLPETALDALAEGRAQALPDWSDGRLQRCLARLGAEARRLLQLAYGEDLPQREIARRLGISHEAVRTRLTRVRGALLRCLEPERT